MSALDDIATERDKSLGIIDGRILAAEGHRIAGFDMAEALKKLRRRRKEVEDKALDDLLASEVLANALKSIRKATKSLNDVAKVMKTVTAFNNRIAEFLGKAKTVADEIQKVSKA